MVVIGQFAYQNSTKKWSNDVESLEDSRLKWKLKLVSYQSWTERPTSSPPTQWPAPALSQCLSAGTRRGAPTSGHVKVMIGACPALWQPFASKQRSLTGQAACETNVNHFCGKTVLITSGYGSNLPVNQIVNSMNQYTENSETIGPWRIALWVNCKFAYLQWLPCWRLKDF